MNRRGFLGALFAGAAAFVAAPLPQFAKLATEGPTLWKFGQITLHARKLACLVAVPNELLKYSHPASVLLDDAFIDQVLRETDLR